MGSGPSSAASNSVIPSIAVPGAPQNVSATGGATRASVSFNPPASDGGSPILGYTVTASPAGPTDSNANGTALTHLLTGLVGGTTYTFTVTASNLAGSGSASLPSNRITANATEGQTYYIHADQLDTPRQITDTQGNVVWRWDNTDPFGNNMPNDNPNGAGQFSFNLRFPGQYADRETNTYYNVNRDYDPAIGRYVESDPIGLRGGINTYAYVEGSPIGYADPDGLRSVIPQGTPWRGTGDINGQIWFGNQARNGAIQNHDALMRRVDRLYGPKLIQVCVLSSCEIPQPPNQCSRTNPTGASSLRTSGPVMSPPDQSGCVCFKSKLEWQP